MTRGISIHQSANPIHERRNALENAQHAVADSVVPQAKLCFVFQFAYSLQLCKQSFTLSGAGFLQNLGERWLLDVAGMWLDFDGPPGYPFLQSSRPGLNQRTTHGRTLSMLVCSDYDIL